MPGKCPLLSLGFACTDTGGGRESRGESPQTAGDKVARGLGLSVLSLAETRSSNELKSQASKEHRKGGGGDELSSSFLVPQDGQPGQNQEPKEMARQKKLETDRTQGAERQEMSHAILWRTDGTPGIT